MASEMALRRVIKGSLFAANIMTENFLEPEVSRNDHAWVHIVRMVIAVVEIVGGVCGLGLVLYGTFASARPVSDIVSFLFFALAIGAGSLLAINSNLGISLSIVVQVLQLFQISISGLLYSAVCGPLFALGIFHDNGGRFVFSASLTATFVLRVNRPSLPLPPWIPEGVAVVWGPWMNVSSINILAGVAIFCLYLIRVVNRERSGADQPSW